MFQPPAVSFSHMGLYVNDLERQERFFTQFLGFSVTDRGHLSTPNGPVQLVFLSRVPEEHHQMVLATGRPAELGFNTLNQMSFRVANLASLRDFFNAMHQAPWCHDITEVSPACHGNALSIYARGPEGNRIELFIDTPWYVNQPLREPFSFEQSDEDIWHWAHEMAKPLPGYRPRAQWVAEMKLKMGMP
ncbi:MAG: glyoxalase [Betaproteobacteria bacterium]|nr:glyoxalase [Betaproteobacteria bacterium]NBY05907.1 glyoxalase [Betaproteobacteria bacterium]